MTTEASIIDGPTKVELSINRLKSETSFVPNGLLGSGTSLPEQDLEGHGSEDNLQILGVSFTHNGLLGDSISRTLREGRHSILPSLLEGTCNAMSNLSTTAAAADTFSSPLPLLLPPLKATDLNGKSIFVMRKRRTRLTVNKPPMETSNRPSNMLEVPVYTLMEQLSSLTAAKLTTQEIESGFYQPSRNKAPEERLWVDRYRPQRFVDLLGDEILLLSGPPGLGKTTLAHVIAAQAGYETVEINASDARSAQVVDERIRPALESGSTVGSKKPVLLVIDEIDGATGGGDNTSGFVHRLLQLTFDKPRVKGKGQNKKEQTRPLLRPIIAICNDLYASSLFRLRQHARIIRFNRPPDIRLVKRLREICEDEGLQAESRALTTLVSVAQGDMRGCINTLQFIKSKTKTVTEPVVRAAAAGMKTAETSLSIILNDLFAPLSRRRVLEMGLSEAQELRFVSRLSQDIDVSGTLNKVAIGCFEHFLTVNTHEPTLERHEKVYEWLTCYDMFSGTMRSERDYALLPYLSFTLIPFYSLFAVKGGSRVERPKIDWEHFNLTKNNEEIANALIKTITGTNTTTSSHVGYRHLTGPTFSLELLPYLNRIISPPLRPVNSQIVKPEEKAAMNRLVDIMVALELQFVQERAEDGSLVYRLEPPIDVFITYDGKRAADVPLSRYAVRKMVAAEVGPAF
ncbi:hypothetical protein Clacol_006805 [Clathrus columnatus]|uniref:AAA+ ATPase domain-containing protein n=1 Tax=Clathrus columnatus TaxID=1419009 RepID=A0AAV5AFQ3_9AGAM|nr:hypothetical protein Clacol_006805 [Clathrus columnatus]